MKRTFITLLLFCCIFSTVFAGDFFVKYMCTYPDPDNFFIAPNVNIINQGQTAVDLANLEVLYFYTKEGTAEENSKINRAKIGKENVIAEIHDGFLSLGFAAGAGSLAAGAETGPIQASINKCDWSRYDQRNDYSYDPRFSTFKPSLCIILIYNGTIVWGIAPEDNDIAPIGPDGPDPAGKFRMAPINLPLGVNDEFSTQIRVNSGIQDVAAIGFTVYYDSRLIELNKNLGIFGLEGGFDRLSFNVNNPLNGEIRFGSFDVWGRGPGQDLELYIFHWKAKAKGICNFTFELDTMIDHSYQSVGVPHVENSEIHIMKKRPQGVPAPTPTPAPEISEAGVAWLTPDQQVSAPGENFTTELYVNTGDQQIDSGSFNIMYDPALVAPNLSIGNNGIEPGLDAPMDFEGNNNPSGSFTFSIPSDAVLIGPGENLHVATIHWTATGLGTAPLRLYAITMQDPDHEDVGVRKGLWSDVTVIPAPGTVFFSTEEYTMNVNDALQTEIHANTGEQVPGAYYIIVHYDPEVFNVNTEVGTSGVESLIEGWDYPDFPVVNTSVPGEIGILNINDQGAEPNPDLAILNVNWIALAAGSTELTIQVIDLNDVTYMPIGTPLGRSATITIQE